jgi:translocator protein
MPEKIKQFLVLIATFAVIFVNYLASTGYIGGITPNFISDKYPTVVTPAGYAFAIWGVIYAGLIIFSIFQAMPMQLENFRKIRTPYLVSCLANCVWIYLWHHELMVASVFAMLVLLASMIAVNVNLSKQDSLIARIPLGIYFGWICVATIANVSICFSYLGMETTKPTAILLTCILIVIATIIGIVMRFKLPNAAFAYTIAWAILAIALKNGSIGAISGVSAFSFMALLVAALLPFIRLKDAKN